MEQKIGIVESKDVMSIQAGGDVNYQKSRISLSSEDNRPNAQDARERSLSVPPVLILRTCGLNWQRHSKNGGVFSVAKNILTY